MGLATVAGIQAFDENQAQASQDALTQRAVEIATDIKSAYEKPDQLGGIELDDTASDIGSAIGIDDNKDIPVEGAGEGGECAITSTDNPVITCVSDDAQNDIQVTFDGEDISTETGDYASNMPE